DDPRLRSRHSARLASARGRRRRTACGSDPHRGAAALRRLVRKRRDPRGWFLVAGLSARNPIPRTTIQRYYKDVCEMSYAERLARADELIADPTPLVMQFTAGIAAFGGYDNPEGFYSNPHRAPKPPTQIG